MKAPFKALTLEINYQKINLLCNSLFWSVKSIIQGKSKCSIMQTSLAPSNPIILRPKPHFGYLYQTIGFSGAHKNLIVSGFYLKIVTPIASNSKTNQ